MPSRRAAIKSLRNDGKKHLKNIRTKSDLRTRAKTFNTLIAEKKTEEAASSLKNLVSRLDKAVSKSMLHKKTASRKKSRLTKRLNKIAQSSNQ